MVKLVRAMVSLLSTLLGMAAPPEFRLELSPEIPEGALLMGTTKLGSGFLVLTIRTGSSAVNETHFAGYWKCEA